MLSLAKKKTFLLPSALFLISLLIFTWGVKTAEITGFDSRFYLFALEMYEKGLHFFPTTYFQPYPDYSAASTSLIVLLARGVGALNKLIAIMPSAIAASLTVVVTYLIAALYAKRWACLATLFLFMTVAFIRDARAISLDMYITLFTSLTFYCLLLADKTGKPGYKKWIYYCWILGFVFRGPIGLIIPTSVMVAYYLVDKRFTDIITTGMMALILLIGSSLLLLGFAYVEGGWSFAQDVFRMQGFSRISNIYLPPYFYFLNSFGNFAISYPLALLMGVEILLARGRGHSQQAYFNHHVLLKLLAWIAIIMIGMSIPGDKKTRYILPMVPALALLSSAILVIHPANAYLKTLRFVTLKVLIFFPALCILLSIYGWFYITVNHFDLHINFVAVFLILFILSLSSLFYCARQAVVAMIATISFLLTFMWIIEPILLYMDKAHAFVSEIEHKRRSANHALVFFAEKPDGLAIKYLINMPKREHPTFIETKAEFLNYNQPAYFVTNHRAFKTLEASLKKNDPIKLVAKDKIGHVDVVVFEKKETKA